METNQGWPERFILFPRLERVGAFLGRLVRFLPLEAPDYMSNHNRGAAAMLDRELYDKPAEPRAIEE